MKCSNWKGKTLIQTPFGKQSPHHAAPEQSSSPVPSGAALLPRMGLWELGQLWHRCTADLGGSEPPFV